MFRRWCGGRFSGRGFAGGLGGGFKRGFGSGSGFAGSRGSGRGWLGFCFRGRGAGGGKVDAPACVAAEEYVGFGEGDLAQMNVALKGARVLQRDVKALEGDGWVIVNYKSADVTDGAAQAEELKDLMKSQLRALKKGKKKKKA